MTLTHGCKTWSLRRRNRSPHECIDNQARWQGQLRSCGRGFDSRCPSFCNQAVGNFGRLGIMANNAGVFTGLKTIREGSETGVEPYKLNRYKIRFSRATHIKRHSKGTHAFYCSNAKQLRPTILAFQDSSLEDRRRTKSSPLTPSTNARVLHEPTQIKN